ncbi:MAG TPA: DMT family transporter [Ferruginibacter sp.]|nr:DMT family transporter [Ferruginibacter sp.]
MQNEACDPDQQRTKNIYTGIGLAVLATLLWSGNFIIAKGVTSSINPVSLSFYRWLIASIIILPFAIRQFISQWPAVRASWQYLFWASLTGVAFFNTFVYIGAHYTSAINLALIGTTSSPIMSVAFARIFLKERIGTLKMAGMILCAIGVLFLLSKGSFQNLLHLHFGTGDLWVLLAAFSFAVYNTLVKKKPAAISPVNFLFTSFSFGTLMMLPFFLCELNNSAPVQWTNNLVFSILYLGIVASVVCFLIWNTAINKIGAGRTALFGNLIPVFASIEAAFILGEDFTLIHTTGMCIVFAGILLANLRQPGSVAVK